MALVKITYVDGVTVITADNLNDIQDAIIALESGGTGPSPYNSAPASLSSSASAGTASEYARGDHRHAFPTASNVGALPVAGGTMSGSIAMGSHKITGLANGTGANDAVNLSQMNDAISSNTAYFRGSFATKAALMAVSWQTTNPAGANYVTNNDYAVVLDDESQSDECWRYVYVSGTGWEAQYRINETPLTQAQLDALNSGATASNISAIAGKITAPSSASDGQFLTYDGNSDAWVATTVPFANGVSF